MWVPREGPRKHLRSLSSPKLELWPKNSKKGGIGGSGYWELCGFRVEVHAKPPGLYEVPNWSYGQKTQKKGGRGEIGGKRVNWGERGDGGEKGLLGVVWVPGGGPRENPRSLSSPKLELWPKNCEKSQFLRGCMMFGLVNFL